MANAPHLFEQAARGQTAAGILDGVMRRAAAKAPEFLILLRCEMPDVLAPERHREGNALQVDWRRACLRYEEEVLCIYMKR